MTPRVLRALAELVDALRAEAETQEQPAPKASRLKVSAAAEELGIAHGWLLELIARGQVKATRYGRVYRIDRAEVDRLKVEGIPARCHRPRLISGGAHA